MAAKPLLENWPALLTLIEGKPTHIDLGTGDGKFVLRLAREHPNLLVIGIDADQAGLTEAAKTAGKKPARGGAPNAHFLTANALEIPQDIKEVAGSLSINFPWGSLLQATSLPSEPFIQTVTNLIKPNGSLTVYLNAHPFNNETLRESLNLPELNEAHLSQNLIPVYEKCGLKLQEKQSYQSGETIPIRTTWGGRLTRNSNRPTEFLSFKKI